MLQTPEGIIKVATITELRTSAPEMIDEAEETGQGILISKKNSPCAVVLSFDRYDELVNGEK